MKTFKEQTMWETESKRSESRVNAYLGMVYRLKEISDLLHIIVQGKSDELTEQLVNRFVERKNVIDAFIIDNQHLFSRNVSENWLRINKLTFFDIKISKVEHKDVLNQDLEENLHKFTGTVEEELQSKIILHHKKVINHEKMPEVNLDYLKVE